MGLTNKIHALFYCQECKADAYVTMQCHSCTTLKYDYMYEHTFYDNDYQIGDVMHWPDVEEERQNWPGRYSFVWKTPAFSDHSGIYEIAPCLGNCQTCNAGYTFYVFINDRKIMRIIGVESAALNQNSVVE